MVVVDTNVLAYLLIEGDHTKEAQALFARDPGWHSEAFLLVEFSNILATYERTGDLTRNQAERLLKESQTRMQHLLSLPHIAALRMARQFAVSAYDARFLATAQQLGARLVTEDARLRVAAPVLTQSIADALTDSSSPA